MTDTTETSILITKPREKPKAIKIEIKVMETLREWKHNSNNWLRIFKQDGGYGLSKCSDRILSTGSPFRKEGFAIMYEGESFEFIEEMFEENKTSMMCKI